MLGEKGYEDSGLRRFPAPDGTKISAHVTAEPLAALAGLRKSKNMGRKNATLKQIFCRKMLFLVAKDTFAGL